MGLPPLGLVCGTIVTEAQVMASFTSPAARLEVQVGLRGSCQELLAAPECVSSLHVPLRRARVCPLSSAWAKFSLLLNPFLCPTNLSGAPPNRVYPLNPFLCLTNQLRGSPRVYPLNPFLYPTGQLRGSPEQSVSIKELQGRLAQVVRPHQEEAVRLTDTV